MKIENQEAYNKGDCSRPFSNLNRATFSFCARIMLRDKKQLLCYVLPLSKLKIFFNCKENETSFLSMRVDINFFLNYFTLAYIACIFNYGRDFSLQSSLSFYSFI